MVSFSIVLFLVMYFSVVLCENKSNYSSFEYNVSTLKTSDGVLVLFTIRSGADPRGVFWGCNAYNIVMIFTHTLRY